MRAGHSTHTAARRTVTTLPHHRLNLTASVVGTGSSGLSHDWPGRAWNRFADFRHYEHLARVARRGVLDAIFLSDHPALSRDTSRAPIHTFDPIVLFSAIAGTVPDIGFLLTASTSYNAPYNLARRIASLDSISGGRVILNLVANFNPDIAANFGPEPLLPREDRYRKADEFVQVLEELFLSWDAPVGPPRRVLRRPRGAQRADRTAGPSGPGPGGSVARRDRLRGEARRDRLRGPAEHP